MTHLDDGQLHAYLDGELAAERPTLERHLAGCAECRERLEAARRLRERSGAVLRSSGPADAPAPPFEEVLRRARGRERRPRTPARVMLAWAASLAVAVTAGWYARGLLSARGAPAAAELARAHAVEARPPAPAQVAAARPAAPTRSAPAANRTQQSPSTAVAAAPAEAAAAVTREQADVAPQPAVAAAKGVAAQEPALAPTEVVSRARTRLAAPTVLNPAGWTTVSRSAAEERLGGRIGAIPELPLLGYAISGTGANTVVRTIQVLGAGMTIELYQRRAAARTEPVAVPAPGAGVTSLTVNWEGYSVTGTAPVPADSLRRLLARLSRP